MPTVRVEIRLTPEQIEQIATVIAATWGAGEMTWQEYVRTTASVAFAEWLAMRYRMETSGDFP